MVDPSEPANVGVNHLKGRSGYTHELLAELTNEQLAEQSEFYRRVKNASSGQASYHHGIHLGAALREQSQRL